jgi:ferredoxin
VAKKLELGDDEPFVIADADESVEMVSEEASFHKLGLCRHIVEAETLINLPKAKTHGQMVITGAVKNCFGAVVGMEKVQWHYRAGRDPEAFARLLVHIHSLVAPHLSLLDAVVGMEGNGPGSGKPRSLGFLAASTDAYALDKVFARILGLENRQVYTLAVGESLGLVPPAFDHIEVIGPDLEELKPDPPWAMAAPKILRDIGSGEWLAPILDRLFTLSPKIDKKLCTGCGQCRSACAADAIAIVGNKSKEGKLALVNKKSCIACFCCQEICPEGAITVSAGFLAHLLGLGLRG